MNDIKTYKVRFACFVNANDQSLGQPRTLSLEIQGENMDDAMEGFRRDLQRF